MMRTHIIKLPDVGEGIAEAEFVELYVKVGDVVQADDSLADVMTDKATVEIPAPVSGTVSWIGPEIGDVIAVGSEIIKVDVAGDGTGDDKIENEATSAHVTESTSKPVATENPAPQTKQNAQTITSDKVLAAPVIRARAKSMGIDLATIKGTGPEGRIVHSDLDAQQGDGSGGARRHTNTKEIKVIGLRKRIAENMQKSKRHIPHFGYVEECDVTALEKLRKHLNETHTNKAKLTILPFLVKALDVAIRDFPQMNARFDDQANVITQYGALHAGIATQTDNGLMVPVLHHAEALDPWQIAEGIKRIATAAREGRAKSNELSGSTITITSLGALGGIATIPVINYPEVGIIGINKISTEPKYDAEGQLRPRKMMNISSSFDHRVVDGHDAAEFIQRIKGLLENPAELFM